MADHTSSCVTGNHSLGSGRQLCHPIMSTMIALIHLYRMLRETSIVALLPIPQQETAGLWPGLGGRGPPYNLACLFLIKEGGVGERVSSTCPEYSLLAEERAKPCVGQPSSWAWLLPACKSSFIFRKFSADITVIASGQPGVSNYITGIGQRYTAV